MVRAPALAMPVRSPAMLSALALALGLVAYNLVTNLMPHAGRLYVARHLVLGGVLVAIARLMGTSFVQLGLAGDRLADGWRWGGMAVLLVAIAIATGGAMAGRVPAVRRLFEDRRADLAPRQLAYHALARIPIGTAAFEELAFRGVLLALLARAAGPVVGVAVSSIAFGLWHIGPTAATARANDRHAGWGILAGAVAGTTVAGLAFAWLRIGSGSLLAPVLAHTASNVLGLLASAVVQRTSRPGRR